MKTVLKKIYNVVALKLPAVIITGLLQLLSY